MYGYWEIKSHNMLY